MVSVRLLEDFVGKMAHFAGHGGGEEQVLPPRGQCAEDLPDAGEKAHVEHVVGFVEHQDLDPVQAENALLHEIEHAAGAPDHDLRLPPKRRRLAPYGDAAVDGGQLQAGELGQRAELVGDLGGQFTGGCEHQNPGRAGDRDLQHAVQDGERERRGLAGAGLGQPQDILAGHGRGNGVGLDGPGGIESQSANAAREGLVEPEVIESTRGNCNGLGHG